MSNNARTMLEQARSFGRHGDRRRALDLLRRARLLVTGDIGLTREILQEMVAVGRPDEVVIWRAQLADIERTIAPAAPTALSAHLTVSRSRLRRAHWTWISVAASVSLVGGIVFWIVGQIPGAAPRDEAPANLANSQAPRDSKSVAKPAPPPVVRAAPPGSASEREQRFRDNVGKAIWYQRLEAYDDARNLYVRELTLSSGSAFAIGKPGIMLTNRHVVREEGLSAADLKAVEPFTPVGKPQLVVCFGPEPTDHLAAKVLHASEEFDFAVLQISREFKRPFTLHYEGVATTEYVLAVGYPGAASAVSRLLNDDFFRNRNLQAQKTGAVHYYDRYTPDDFKPSVTSGIISIDSRMLGVADYYQFDAKIGHGNSGGPLLLRETSEVIGIVTLKAGGGASTPELEGYNYALKLPQLREEIERYTK